MLGVLIIVFGFDLISSACLVASPVKVTLVIELSTLIAARR